MIQKLFERLLKRPERSVQMPRPIEAGFKDYEAVGQEFLGHFQKLGGLRADHAVLDIGCGYGRMASPLVRFLTDQGSYCGFDTDAEAVAWCRKHVNGEGAPFRFDHLDVANRHYNRDGVYAGDAVEFPYADGQFDFVFLCSVFTHLLPATVDHYLEEIHRALKPGGSCFGTFLLLNGESRALIAEGRSKIPLCQDRGDYMTNDPDDPERGIAYPERDIRQRISQAGFTLIEPIHYGLWCGRKEFLSYQDIAVFRKSEI